MENLFSSIYSSENLIQAFQRVAENGGCAGCDGVWISDIEKELDTHLTELQQDLKSGMYHPFPLMRISVPKRNGKGKRFLSIPTVRDRIAQTAVFLVTRNIFEREFENISHAYREGRG